MTYQHIHEGVHSASALMGIPLKRTDAEPKTDHVKQFVALARSIPGKPFRVFDDWCEIMFCAIAAITAQTPERAAELMSQQEQASGKYTQEDIRIMEDMLGVAQVAIMDGGRDFLGEACGLLGALDGGVGQFFTPFEVSKMIVSMTAPDISAIVRDQGNFRGADPAAGSGGLLVALADHCEAVGVDLRDVFVEGVELVPSTYHMLFVQLSLRGVPARAVCGNTLTQEVREYAYTPAGVRFVNKHGIMNAATNMR
ncbi:N-6 DNA methylase [Paracoccus limosus]|nr:N-6 DNA methylase [Paracoccus limosus]